MANMTPTDALERISQVYDESTDFADGQWDSSSDIAEAVATILDQAGYMTHCPYHGQYASYRDECPMCAYCPDCECSPCECSDDDEEEEEDL